MEKKRTRRKRDINKGPVQKNYQFTIRTSSAEKKGLDQVKQKYGYCTVSYMIRLAIVEFLAAHGTKIGAS